MMTTLDVREEQKEEATSIIFDDTYNRIEHSEVNDDGVVFVDKNNIQKRRYLVEYGNIDNFILALKKAKELWDK